MQNLPQNSLDACEQGDPHAVENKSSSKRFSNLRSILYGTLVILTFNALLAAFLYLCYLRMMTYPDDQQKKFQTIMHSLFWALVVAYLLYLGDLSKDNPFFYYI